MSFKKACIPLLAMGMVVFADVSYAAFGGSRGGGGVSRAYSRPATTTYSKPATTYKAAPAPTYRQTPSTNYSNNSGYSNNRSNYQQNYSAPRQNSAMRDIGVTAAGVAGGVLAATAITALVSSPNHSGMFTHPQYPGQYFNQQGQPVSAPPAPPAQAQQQQVMPEQYAQPAQPQYQQARPVVQQESGGFFSALWGFLWGVIQLIFFIGIVGAIAFGVYKLFLLGRTKEVQEKVRETLNVPPSMRMERDDLDSNAMDIFYNFQKNSNNETWVRNNTKYLPVKECLSAPSEVLQYEHRTIDCAVEQGKLRGSVLFNALLNDGSGEVRVKQYWNFEKDNGTWKLIGFESND